MKSDFNDRARLDALSFAADQLRQREEGYVGLLGIFRQIQDKMTRDFQAAGAIKHPGDKGTARENVLRDFLQSEYLPRRYAASDMSSHAVSTTGHKSAQLDLLMYDALLTPNLMSVGGVRYFPIESCYGIIESKSDLRSGAVVRDGLDKIAAFKKLRSRRGGRLGNSPAFGILFAPDASLSWSSLFNIIKEWEAEHPASEWANMVVVIGQGIIGHVENQKVLLQTSELTSATKSELHALAMTHDVLLNFYLFLLDLLGGMRLSAPPMRSYVELPLTAGRYSYNFELGHHAQMSACDKHGPWMKTMSEQTAQLVVSGCGEDSKMSYGELLRLAYGDSHQDVGFLGDGFLYDPEGLRAEGILTRPASIEQGDEVLEFESVDFTTIVIDGLRYWIPNFYIVRDQLLSGCPKCDREPAASKLTVDDWKQMISSL